jgi:hypothetical protein
MSPISASLSFPGLSAEGEDGDGVEEREGYVCSSKLDAVGSRRRSLLADRDPALDVVMVTPHPASDDLHLSIGLESAPNVWVGVTGVGGAEMGKSGAPNMAAAATLCPPPPAPAPCPEPLPGGLAWYAPACGGGVHGRDIRCAA